MVHSIQAALAPSAPSVWLDLVLILEAFLYLRGWTRLRLSRVNIVPAWRAASFLLGLLFIWVAVGSPLAAFDEQLLTVHMAQHLLLMTVAPALILLGAPLMPLLHGLPRYFMQIFLAPLLRYPPMQRLGRLLSSPAVCWLAATAALVGWHVPSVFTLALQSEGWHIVEHSSFLAAGFLFWWPVIQPWPSASREPRWFILLYLFLATLPCDILSGYLSFCDRVVYPVYLNTPRPFGISALADQQCAGALMWSCITILYLLPAAMLTMQLLTTRTSLADAAPQAELQGIAVPQRDSQGLEAV
jgi:putative membrane protein